MSSTDSGLPAGHGRLLLEIARDSIRHGLDHDGPPGIDLAPLPPELGELGASFVTLHLDSRLRGCIGSLEARRPLALDISFNAHAAAFRDPRFPAVCRAESECLDLEISLLTPAEPLFFETEEELLAQLVPFVDGLILAEGGRRGTFLPVVWESLPQPGQFLEQLKAKAGLPRGYWSDRLQAWRYRTEVIK
jgi:AmmeMemoRadiSam system protein A